MVVQQQLGVVGGFRLVLGGELNIADILVIQAEVKFRLELAGDNPGIELIMNGMMDIVTPNPSNFERNESFLNIFSLPVLRLPHCLKETFRYYQSVGIFHYKLSIFCSQGG